jgi:hypothetical protein
MKRTRKVTVQSEETGERAEERATRATSTVVSERRDAIDASAGERDELTATEDVHELRGAEGRRQLPSAE